MTTMLKTQDDAVRLIGQLFWCVRKLRSNAKEGLVGGFVDEEMADRLLIDLMPKLFDEEDPLNLFTVMEKYSAKCLQEKRVDPGDMYNALYLCQREPSIGIVWTLLGYAEMPTPIEAMRQLMKITPDMWNE